MESDEEINPNEVMRLEPLIVLMIVLNKNHSFSNESNLWSAEPVNVFNDVTSVPPPP